MMLLFTSDIWLCKRSVFFADPDRIGTYCSRFPALASSLFSQSELELFVTFVICVVCLTMRLALVVARALRWPCIDLFSFEFFLFHTFWHSYFLLTFLRITVDDWFVANWTAGPIVVSWDL